MLVQTVEMYQAVLRMFCIEPTLYGELFMYELRKHSPVSSNHRTGQTQYKAIRDQESRVQLRQIAMFKAILRVFSIGPVVHEELQLCAM